MATKYSAEITVEGNNERQNRLRISEILHHNAAKLRWCADPTKDKPPNKYWLALRATCKGTTLTFFGYAALMLVLKQQWPALDEPMIWVSLAAGRFLGYLDSYTE